MRYCGSKARIANEIIPIITEHLAPNMSYIEPFVGGCNIFSKIPNEHKIGLDINHYVIDMWKAFKSGIRPPKEVTDKMYGDMRKLASEGKESQLYPNWLIGYVGNSCSYGSAWFNGFAKLNVNRGENHVLEAYNNIMRQLDTFKNLDESVFISGTYQKITDFGEKAVIYCDPPYANTKEYCVSFNNDTFWEWVRFMCSKGHLVYVSEYDAPEDFVCVWQKEVKDGMGTTKMGDKQKNKIEKIFVYGGN